MIKNTILHFISGSVRNRNRKFVGRHNGESCYIFGNGISLKYFDLSKFSDRVGIGCNNLFFHKDFNELNVKYYFTGHPFFYYPYWKNPRSKKFVENRFGKMFAKKILESSNISFFLNLSNYFGLRGDNIFYLYHFDEKFTNYSNCNISSRFTAMEGSLQAMLGLAINLGFTKITLVGCDYTFYPQSILHFFEYGKEINNYPERPFIESYLKSALEHADIETVLTDEKYEGHCIKGTTYQNMFNLESKFQENVDIVDVKILDELDNCEVLYKIYSN